MRCRRRCSCRRRRSNLGAIRASDGALGSRELSQHIMPTPIDQLTNGHAPMGVSAGNKPLDLTEFFQRRQRLLREQERERAHAQWERREGILPAQMTAAMQMLSRMAGRAYYPKDLSPDNLPKKVYRQLYQDYQSAGDRDFSKPHVVEITPTPDNSAEAQAAIFSGAGVEHNPGARYGYRTDNDSKQAAFPTPLTEEQMASCDLLVEHLASCADQLRLDAAAVESLVNLRESITDPDEYQAVV